MKMHSFQASNNCRRAQAVIEHLGLDVEIIPHTSFETMKQAEFLGHNPNGKVPTLIDGDLSLWESRAIMQYLCSKKPGQTLWPTDAKKQADVSRWMFWETAHLSKGTVGMAFENLFKQVFMKQGPDATALAAAEKEFHTFAPVLNAQLEGKKWVCGNEMTLADFSVAGCFSFAAPAKYPMSNYTHINAWLKRMDEVPAWKNTAPKLPG